MMLVIEGLLHFRKNLCTKTRVTLYIYRVLVFRVHGMAKTLVTSEPFSEPVYALHVKKKRNTYLHIEIASSTTSFAVLKLKI